MPKDTLLCPLPHCDWSYEPPTPNDFGVGPATLGSVFGVGTMYQTAQQQIMMRTERALTSHFAEHRTVEWVKALREANDKIAEMEIQIEALTTSGESRP